MFDQERDLQRSRSFIYSILIVLLLIDKGVSANRNANNNSKYNDRIF